jgi:hypothetical protein
VYVFFSPLKFLYLVVQGFVSRSEGKETEIPFLAYSSNVEVKTYFAICFSLLERKKQQKNEGGGGGGGFISSFPSIITCQSPKSKGGGGKSR